MVYLSAVEFFKQHVILGVRCQCSGVSKQMAENRKHRVNSSYHQAIFFGLLPSGICPLKTDT